MIDNAVIHISSGTGGNGSIHGRREKHVPRGGPDGGDGGDGGSVVVRTDPNLNTLMAFSQRRRFEARGGENGSGARKHGQKGPDIVIDVPLGTHVWDDGSESPLLADLESVGEYVVVARGGKGGRGNARFASSTNQYPRLAEAGESGEGKTLRLELKLLADVGIIGEPNAGKSSLLAAVSQARPKVAAYPFTTLEPHLGVVEWRRKSFVMVDIPGLIEGAHLGVGLGIEFLRHIERTDVLVHVIDGTVEDPQQAYRQINLELGQHSNELLDKPQIVMINKIDLPGAIELSAALEAELKDDGIEVHLVSVATRDGVDAILDTVLSTLENTRSERDVRRKDVEPQEVPVLRPRPQTGAQVSVRDGVYVVDAPGSDRIAAMVDMGDWDAKMQFHDHLRRRGVLTALEEAGIEIGDTVRLGAKEWEWE